MRTMLFAAAAVASLAAGCAPAARDAAATGTVASAVAQAEASPAERAKTKVLFGDLHMHTGWSFDAFTFGTTATPEDAYNFAQGGALAHPAGGVYRLDRPLDFLAVTDHSEFMGVMIRMRDPSSPLSKLAIAKAALDRDPKVSGAAFRAVANAFRTGDLAVFEDQADTARKVAADTWGRVVEIANRQNKPGKFTALIGYEWTSSEEGKNLHRNVIFRGDNAPLPFTAVDSRRPEDLWKYLDATRQAGQPVLAIPHNSNLSDGAMFAKTDSDGKPIDAAYAATRARNEPMVEITQVKGTSEAHPALSPNDEFANFELLETYVASDKPVTKFAGSYVRDAWRTGLSFQDGSGFNPYRFGVIGSTDSHVAMSPVIEKNYWGKVGLRDGTPQVRLDCTYCAGGSDISKFGSAGLAAVWARENTRAAIFDALQRNETYGTSGPRMQVRFFGGYGMDRVKPGAAGWVETAYGAGVPMGATLPAAGGKAPSFVVWALKDAMGANLDRVQIIKLWSKNGVSHEKIYDVALSGGRKVDPGTGKAPPVGNTVDVASATYKNSIGAVSLTANWTDPEFDASAPAAYYVRVLEIPTPRWSTYDAAKLKREIPRGLAPTIQERAFTSAIWYTPAPGRRG
ncbi:DUF3604 domain-containing protein [Phenylobacterium sp.]|uniref:DUF3604 domain-containing protein n=1 Tax=Phenylobacterium sp. TaxID=1871053 RepID=UPI0025D1C9CF|nr:DUF3604 domain-containing protein [Phenylobacterium sp.]